MAQKTGAQKAAVTEAGQAVTSTWVGMTVLRATALLGMIVAYLGTLGSVFHWFRDDFRAFREQEPWLFWSLIVLPLLFVGAFSVGPELLRQIRQARRERLALDADLAVPNAQYFRLDPYVTDKPEDFRRADGAHERILRWLQTTSRPILFLSGSSGTGKSSLLEAYVLPMLERAGWRVETVRSFGDPLDGLEEALRRRRGKTGHLLVVFDQFEEFVILQNRAASEAGQRFLTRVRELREQPMPNGCLLFVIRTDYLNAVIELALEEFVSGQSWHEIDPFKRTAARVFLEGSPHRPTNALTERLLDGAEAMEEAPGLFRPVTLNMLGLALDDFDRQVKGRPERLIQGYLEAALAQREIREIAPRVVGELLSEAGTKRPRALAELVADTHLREGEIKLCLARLASKGLVRTLDTGRSLWEISHDFVAKQLAILLGRLRLKLWPLVAMWTVPLLFALCLGALLYSVPLYLAQHASRELQRLGGAIFRLPDGTMEVGFGDETTNDLLAMAVPVIDYYKPQGLGLGGTKVNDLAPLRRLTALEALDLSNTPVTDLAALDGFTTLRTLNLGGTDVSNLAPLQGLSALETLNLANSSVTNLKPLGGLGALKSLDLAGTPVVDLAALHGLASLQALILAGTGVIDLTPLRDLAALETLYLSDTRVISLNPLEGLGTLKTLGLSGTQVTDLTPLRGVASLQKLELAGTRVTDLSPLRGAANLQMLDLGGTQVTDLSPLQGLTGLKQLRLDGTAVANLGPLRDLTALEALDLSGTKVTDLTPLQGLTTLQTLDVQSTEVTDMTPLRGMIALEWLRIRSVHVSDLAPLRNLIHLKIIDVRDITSLADDDPVLAMLRARGVLIVR
jgi:Leucine-rich repeat (LRR) protein